MKVKIHPLFQHLLKTTEADPEAIVGYSLSRSPKLREFLTDIDPELPLDWNNQAFAGLPELRSHVLRITGLDALSIEDVLITAGAAEANYLAIRQLVARGAEIVTDTPGWPQVGVLAKAVGARLRTVRRHPDRDWTFPLDELAASINKNTAMIFLSNPNNPSGQLLGESELRQIVDLARPHGAHVLIDEVYAGLEWNLERAPSIAGMYERGITTGSVSKALGLQGLRTGWLVSADTRLLRDAMILRENSSEIMNVLGEVIAEIALRTDRYTAALETARMEGRDNLHKLKAFIATSRHLSWTPPQAGLIGLARLPEHIESDDLCERLLAPPYRTFVLPGSVYGEPQHIRVGVGGGPDTNFALGLERLSTCLSRYFD